MSEITVVSTEATQTEAMAEKSAEVAKVTPEAEQAETPDLVAQDAVETDENHAEGSEAEEGEEGSKDATQAKPKKKSGWQRKLAKKDQEIEFWREQALRSQKPEPKETPVAEKTEKKDGAPEEKDFEDHIDYLKAVSRWEAKQELAQERAKEREKQLKSEMETEAQKFKTRWNEFAEKNEDFEDVLDDVGNIVMPLTLQQIVQQKENGLEIWYELAKNKDEYKRICGLNAIDAALEIGMFQAKLESKSSPSQKTTELKTTKAPAPITPVGSKSTGAVKKSIYDPNISQADFEAIYREQRKSRSAWG